MVAGRDCLDEEALQAWVAGTLSGADKARAQEHLAECDLCFSAVAEVHALSGPAPARPSQRYVLGVEVGRGGMGVVYKARDALLDRDVAVKVLHGAWDEPQLRERLVDESVAMARLRHPNIVAVHDVVIGPDAAFVVMELVEGRTLRLWAEAESRSPGMVLDTFMQIGEGLAAAHAAGVVHRDFKPDNVLVGADHRPQIADFGIASTMRSDAPVGGTHGYMAPEVFAGGGGDARADQYAFCVSFWEVLYGAPPSARSGEHGHRRIQSVLRRGLEETPSDRFADMNALLAALRAARRSRRPWFAAAATCVALVVGVALLPASATAPVCDRLALAGPSDDAVVAITRTLRERDGLRGELLAQQALHDVARIEARLNDASEEVCEAVDASPRVGAVANACIRDAAAELAFMLDHAERGDLGPLSDLLGLPDPGLCLPYARHGARLPAAVERVAAARVRDDLTEATVLGRRYDERAVPAGERVLASVRGWGRSDLEARAHAAIGWARWDADPDAGRDHFARATKLAEAHGHPALRARLWVKWGLLAKRNPEPKNSATVGACGRLNRRVAPSRTEASAARRRMNRARAAERTHKRVRARAVVPGARVLVTRRCHDRRFFLSPFGDPRKGHTAEQTTNFYGYTLARAALKYGTQIHAACQMGNHHHLSITDVLGNRPNFKNSVHGNLARGLNGRFGRFDTVWSGGGSCDTVAPSDHQSLDDLAYTDCNPVTSGLVKWAHLWPGFTTYGWRFGETRTFKRPDWYFDPENPDNAETITLTRVRPPIFLELSDDELFDKLMARCMEIQRAKQDEYETQNRRFMGLKKLAKTKWWKRAKSWEDRFTQIPTVAASDKGKRVAQLKRDAEWRAEYAEQLKNLKAGRPTTLPYGAYLLPRIYGVPMAKPP